MMTAAQRILKKVEDKLPIYHTREMTIQFVQQIGNFIIEIPKHINRGIYIELAMDDSAEQNPEMDERVRQAILGEDLDLVIDLSQLDKGRPPGTFDVLFGELEKVIDELKEAKKKGYGVAQLSHFRSGRDTNIK